MIVLFALLSLALAAAMPAVIRALPEPPPDPEAVPAEGEPETELQRMLREEGPRPTYVSIASTPRLGRFYLLITLLVDTAVIAALGSGANQRVGCVVVVLTPVLLLLAHVDARARILPRLVVLPVTGVLILLALLEWAITRETHVLVREAIAMVVARSFFWILWFIRSTWMGFGDVRLAALVGLVLGRISWSAWLIGLYGGMLLSGLVGVALLLVQGRKALRKGYPYGPYLVAGLYLGVLTSGAFTLV